MYEADVVKPSMFWLPPRGDKRLWVRNSTPSGTGMIFGKHWTISDEPKPPISVTDPSVFHLACFPYVVPATFATHPRPTVSEGFTPALNSQTGKSPTSTVLRNEDSSTKIRPSLTVRVFEAP